MLYGSRICSLLYGIMSALSFSRFLKRKYFYQLVKVTFDIKVLEEASL